MKINRDRILKTRPINPKINGRILITDGQLAGIDGERTIFVSLINMPDVKPIYSKASCKV